MIRSRAMAMLAVLIGTAAVSGAESWDSAARQAAVDILVTTQSRSARVTFVEPDGRQVYFSGFPPGTIKPGDRISILRKGKSAELDEVGLGTVESFQGLLAWATVDTEVSALIFPDDTVRPAGAASVLSIGPFLYEAPARGAHLRGARRGISVTRVFRSLISMYLREQGLTIVESPLTAADLNDSFLPNASVPQRTILCHFRDDPEGADTALTARLILHSSFPGDNRHEKEYRLDLPRGFDFAEESAESSQDNPDLSPFPEDPLPSTLVRISIGTAPTGLDFLPGWPPRTPADRILLDAISVSLNTYATFWVIQPEERYVFLLPRDALSTATPVTAYRLESLLNARHGDMAKFQFQAQSDTELILHTTMKPAEIGQILSDPIFKLIDPAVPGLDIGLGPYSLATVAGDPAGRARQIVLNRNPMRSWLANWEETPDTIVLLIDTDARMRQARFELGETDFHEMTDAEFLKYTGSTAYLNRVVRSRNSELMVLLFQLSRLPLSELAVRRAVTLALDRKATLGVLLNNRGKIASGFDPAPRTDTGHVSRMPHRSIAAAKELIASAPRPIRLGLLIPEEDPVFLTVAERIQADLRPLSIGIDIQRAPWTLYESRKRSGQFDLALDRWPAGPGGIRRLLSASPENGTGYHSSTFDALCRNWHGPSDPSQDDAIQDLLLTDLPAAPLYHLFRYAVLGTRIRAASFFGESIRFETIRPARREF